MHHMKTKIHVCLNESKVTILINPPLEKKNKKKHLDHLPNESEISAFNSYIKKPQFLSHRQSDEKYEKNTGYRKILVKL